MKSTGKEDFSSLFNDEDIRRRYDFVIYTISNLISSNILYIDSWISDIKRHTINGDMKFFMNLARKCIAMTYMSFYWRVKYLLELKFPPILGKKIFYQKEGTIFLYVYIHFHTRFIISFSLQHNTKRLFLLK